MARKATPHVESASPLTSDSLSRGAHRLVWWLLKNQERDTNGTPTGVVLGGWRVRARTELGVSDVALWKMQKALKEHGILEGHAFSRVVRLRAEAFH